MLTKQQQQKIDSMKNCIYCGSPVEHGRGYHTVGLCEEHSKIWKEDIASGFKRNRLKEMQQKINERTEVGDQMILNL